MKPTIIGGKKPDEAESQPSIKPTVVVTKTTPPVMEQQKMKPTVFKPTAIADSPVVEKKKIGPTTWATAVKSPAAVPTSPRVEAHPSSIPGQQRKTIVVSVDELKAQFSSYELPSIIEAHDILTGIILNSVDTSFAISFGTDVQQSYSQCVDSWLKILEGDQIRTTGRHVQRLKEVLQTVADSLTGNQPWFRRETIQERFHKVKPELEQLRTLLCAGEKQISLAQAELIKLKSSTHRLIIKAIGYMIASEYLIGKLQNDSARILTDRGISLAKTVSALQTQVLKLEQDEQNITALLYNIQDGVFNALPSLLSVVATTIQDEKNDTQRFVIRDQVMDVIRKLT